VSTRSELGKIVANRIVPAVADLEKVIHRNGYFRVLATTIVGLGFIGILGQILGVTWLRYVYGILAALLFLLTSAVAFGATQRLRERVARSESILHEYADSMPMAHAIGIDECREEVTIERNGDALIKRRYVLKPLEDSDAPRYLTMNTVYYGETPLTDRDKRLVEVKVRHGNTGSGEESVLARATSRWGQSSHPFPKLEVYIHLGKSLQDGDTVIFECSWPRYSRDLTTGRSSETFDVMFTKEIAKVYYRAIFRDIENDSVLNIVRGSRVTGFRRQRVGKDVLVTFEEENPPLNVRMGFRASYESS
jgi:hypothetical protein